MTSAAGTACEAGAASSSKEWVLDGGTSSKHTLPKTGPAKVTLESLEALLSAAQNGGVSAAFEEALAAADLSPVFIAYMRRWKGFVTDGRPAD